MSGVDDRPSAVLSGDFNHDGVGDIAWQNAAAGDVSAWLMTFTGQPSVALIFV